MTALVWLVIALGVLLGLAMWWAAVQARAVQREQQAWEDDGR